MTINVLSFEESSEQIVSQFLHSVVVVDDRASLSLKDIPVEKSTVVTEKLTIPTRFKRVGIDPSTTTVSKGVGLSSIKKENESVSASADLDAKILVDTFADNGLVCAILKPIDKERGLNEKTNHATHKSDIVILDWQIGDEKLPGTIALGLIKKIISTDSEDRLRLIAIYTSNPDLNEIAEKVKVQISTEKVAATIIGFEVNRGPIKVVIYQKAGGSNSIANDRVANEAELPKRLIKDFTVLTRGLLSNVALKSLGTLRENTHRILNKFNKKIDASYVTHKVLSNPPDEAENHPIPLIASELLDVLEDAGINNLVSGDFINKWLQYQISLGLNFTGKFQGLDHEKTLNLIKMLLEIGVENQKSFTTTITSWDSKIKKLKNEKDVAGFLTGLFSLPGTKNLMDLDMDFAILTTIRSKYEYPAPLLTLGSIVVEETTLANGVVNKAYYCCIQPLCDSVRLHSARKFSFIPLEIPSKDKFHIVVKDKGIYVKLLTDLRPYNTLMIEFNPKTKGEILAKKSGDDWVFTSSSGTNVFRWIADLKFPHAQRIITQYSEQLGRIGLTESDWLRRMAR